MFAKAREAEMDLDALGQRMVTRKTELMTGNGPKSRGGMLTKLLER